MSEDLLVRIDNGIAEITLNRPAQRNALTFSMYERIREFCERTVGDSSLRAIIVTGAGEKAFAAGTDISEFHAVKTGADGLAYEGKIERVLTAFEALPIPTIAAISGACTGGGAAIAACCDLRIGTASTKFGFPIARTLGNCLSAANYARLASLIGVARVKDLIFTARLMEAPEAQSLGLLNEIVDDHAALMRRAHEIAATVAAHAPITLRVTKEALRRVANAQAAPNDDDLIALAYGSDDFREGVASFLGKRPPKWTGR
ncbi:MAG: enoyl-CoA hydratase/isomerase family protein [Hyphomicrobiales bacterium]|nr:enoyl-CoA hydratase/isomerase family protein [Hyphomicrobiales bacterium]